MLCWVLVEQARHEHMPDKYINRSIIIVLPYCSPYHQLIREILTPKKIISNACISSKENLYDNPQAVISKNLLLVALHRSGSHITFVLFFSHENSRFLSAVFSPYKITEKAKNSKRTKETSTLSPGKKIAGQPLFGMWRFSLSSVAIELLVLIVI